ncbi:MAG: response regulator [Candidatus Xenobiia bacterium LiM19]
MKILAVDDSAAVRKKIRIELEDGGYEVFEAVDGVDAFKVLVTLRPDLITLDVDMPHMNGFETCRKLRESRYDRMFRDSKGGRIPIVFLTASDTLEGRARGFEAGATEFIVKPFDKGELLKAVNRILKADDLLHGLTAVVADDSRIARNIVTDFLTILGVNVLEAENGVEAIRQINANIASVDIVITDLEMPEMGGEELCRQIRKELMLRDLPVIVLTAMPERGTLLKLFDAGATDYLIKPFVQEELLARLKVHLDVRLLNRELQSRLDTLKKFDRMKDRFLAVCSHDLRSPLNGIISLTSLMQEEENLTEENKEFLAMIVQSGEYLLSLIENLLDIHRIASDDAEMDMKPISILDVAKTSIDALKFLAYPKNIELSVEDRSGGRTINGDALSLTRVVNNLLSNSIKFTPRGGKVSVTIEAVDESHISLTVSDTGVGIPEKKLKQLMEKKKLSSERGTEGESGTGLGLTIVREISDKHGAVFTVKSAVGAGSEFIITFPSIT